jgi:hypothetical protein
MAASVLSSPKAVEMSVEVVRAFVRLRQILASNRQLAAKVEELERKLAAHDKTLLGHHGNIRSLFMVIENLMPALSKRQIGFRAHGERKKPPADRKHERFGHGAATARVYHRKRDARSPRLRRNPPCAGQRGPCGCVAGIGRTAALWRATGRRAS